MRRQHYRARAIGVQQRPVPWWAWALVAGAAVAAVPTWGQSAADPAPLSAVPEAVRPRSDSPTIPQGNDGSAMPVPKSENPQVNGVGRPVPDRGVIAPPLAGAATTPVIPPPGSPGGDKGVVPK